MTKIFLIGGLGETAESYGQGMADLADRLRRPWRAVRRVAWKDAINEIVLPLIADSSTRGVVLIGHSFGGDVAVEIGNELPDRFAGVVTVDLTPRSYWTKFTAKVVPVNPKIECLNIRRSRGMFPLSKAVAGQRAINIEMPGDHNSVMRAIETHKKIEAQVAAWADTITRIADREILRGDIVYYSGPERRVTIEAIPGAGPLGVAKNNARPGESVSILQRWLNDNEIAG